MARNISRFETHESIENEFESSSTLSISSPSRAPLNSIPDPSQLQKVNQRLDSDLVQTVKVARAQHHRTPGPEKRIRVSAMHDSTPRTVGRYAKARSEPNSAQSTPARSRARVSLMGGARVVQTPGVRGKGSSSRIPRAISLVDSLSSADVPHFELNEDVSFWKEHNVQVLIRVRPLNTTEKASQGYVRCLKQESPHTLVWLGHPETRFTFDHVACETISQEKLFRVAGLPMVENCLSGYNSCMFAYGQTGSGKTYTMMGEISEVEGTLSNHCGITPRILEYLFSRIKMEEEGRRDERLKFSCKCSFLEIYNEHITDLLEPSSTNLQLREDSVKGVYVENLIEYDVRNVHDVLKLLQQGEANRKIAATRMNSESSRSHSVLTCTVESCWERDSLTHFRFARLNLVDLAGSERQKSTGAERDRLKEAANINKSLSTLGLVIMSLVDLAHGKQRHVPYRDSRLTFLLKDSLGGNSKTMIIANVSPSLCSANETLTTLKFAQRAKLIQNNAKINEDSSADVSALEQEIRKLKGQLSSLMKNQNSSKAVADCLACLDESRYSGLNDLSGELLQEGCHCQMPSPLSKKVKSLKDILIGALRREKVVETALQKSKAEIERINSLAEHRKEVAQCTKMKLSLCEEKVKQLEMLISGSTQEYLMEETKTLKGEIKLFQESIDRDAEMAHCALENIRLREKLQVFQNFYELGERETLLSEISELRDQLLDVLEANNESLSGCVMNDNEVEKELENCRKMNSSLSRELHAIHGRVGRYLNFDQTADFDTSSHKELEQFRQADNSSLGKEALERNSWSNMDGASSSDHSDIRKELMESRSLIEAMEAEQVQLINELKGMQEENDRNIETLRKNDNNERESFPKVEAYDVEFSGLDLKAKDAVMETDSGIDKYILQIKLEKLSKDLEEARKLNCKYEKDQNLKLSHQQDIELVQEQVETETATTILQLHEEVLALQSEFQERICKLTQENQSLKDSITAKEAEINTLNQDWEKATIELTSFIVDGSKSIDEASTQIESIICSFPHDNVWIGDHVEKAAKVCLEKEETVLFLQKSLEDAQILLADMDLKLKSLKGATVALNEIRLQDNVACMKETILLSNETDKTSNAADRPDSKFGLKQLQILESERHAKNALAVPKCLSDSLEVFGRVDIDSNACRPHLAASIDGRCNMPNEKSNDNPFRDNDTNETVQVTCCDGMDHDSDIHALFTDIQVHLEASTSEFFQMYVGCKHLVQDAIREIHEIRLELLTLKRNHGGIQLPASLQSGEPCKSWMSRNQGNGQEKIKDQPAKISGTVSSTSGSSTAKENLHRIVSCNDGYLSEETYGTSEDSLTSSSDYSISNISQMSNMIYPGVLLPENGGQDMHDNVVSLASVNENESGQCVYCEEVQQPELVPFALATERAEKECKYSNTSSFVVCEGLIQRMDPARSFFKRFEAVNATMKEADLKLRQLVEANEMWRQTDEEQMVERTSLMADLEQLRSSVSLCEKENQFLLNQTHSTLVDMSNSISMLEENFLQMKRGVEETLEVQHSDVLSVGKELIHLIANSKPMLEQMFFETMERGFAQDVAHECHIGKLIDQILDQSNRTVSPFPRQEKCVMECNAIGSAGENNITRKLDGVVQSGDSLIYENLSLKKELERKEALFEGLLFDFRLLQESASNKRDIKDETDELIDALCQAREDLEQKTIQVDDLTVQKKKLENCLSDLQMTLFMSKSDLEKAEERIHILMEKNDELAVLVKDLCLKKTAAEEAVEEQKELVKGLESEILNLTNTAEMQVRSSLRTIEEDLRKVADEKEQLLEEIRSLNDKLEMAYAIADEKEAIAIEARQDSEASKIYAEQKEEEVKILEISVEELENTVNVLEERVYDMDEDVKRHRVIRDSLETELHALRKRLLRVENFNRGTEECEGQISRSKELQEARDRIQVLEKEVTGLNKEIKQLKDYVSEVLLHSEAQASGYQEKYKSLETMVRDINIDASSISTAATSHKTQKSSTKTRGAGSPFRCIAGLVQQMNLDKDQELTMARLHIEELESLLAIKQKEICSLNTRIAAAESMTHDVIRDLLGVKMEMTNYANLVDHYQVRRVVEEAHQCTEEILSKEQEIIKLKKHIGALVEERESCISELNKKEADVLATQITLEQLQERVQFLSAQNGILKNDKSNLLRRVAELDQTVKTLTDAPGSSKFAHQTPTDTMSINVTDSGYSKQVKHSNELAKYCKSSNNEAITRTRGRSSGSRFR